MWGNFPLPAELVVPPSELTQVSGEEWARVALAGELDEAAAAAAAAATDPYFTPGSPPPSLLPRAYRGTAYRLANEWTAYLPPAAVPVPLQYLEIGSFDGGSAVSFHRLYGGHPDTRYTCVDPWADSEE